MPTDATITIVASIAGAVVVIFKIIQEFARSKKPHADHTAHFKATFSKLDVAKKEAVAVRAMVNELLEKLRKREIESAVERERHHSHCRKVEDDIGLLLRRSE